MTNRILKLKLVLIVAVALSMAACCSVSIEKKAVSDLQATHDIVFPEYLKLVEKEYAGKPDGDKQVTRRKNLIQSANDITGAMKKKLED